MTRDQLDNLQVGDKIIHISHRRRDEVREVRRYLSMTIVRTKDGRSLNDCDYDPNINLEYWDLDIPIPDLSFTREE